jgi:tryptophanyl-tRNA synthetase
VVPRKLFGLRKETRFFCLKGVKMKKDYTILTGITPSGSGEVHIGNYVGAVVPFFEMAEKAKKIYFFIADLHALTTVQNKKELQANVENLILSYLAFGIDPTKFVFYRQSDIPLHAELQTILNNVTPIGLIKRCHAYKDKLKKDKSADKINMGLFNYPVLMAADILMYEPDYVPVGEDQKQHVEVTRDIVQYFNKTYGQTFKLPEVYIKKQGARLIGTDGKRKMSKSLGNYISVFADEKEIKKQIMACFTDPKRIHPTDPGRVEGNPIFAYHDLINDNKEEVADLKKRYKEGQVGDVQVKEKLFKAHLKKFSEPRKRYNELKKDPAKIKKILKDGAEKATKIAQAKMVEVRQKIGITNKYSFFKY